MTASASSSTTIEVTWDIVPPIDQNGNITMYEVLYQSLETFDGAIMTQTMIVMSPDITSLTLMSLEEYVIYNISVRAYTSAGPGVYSEGTEERTFEDGKRLVD